MPDDPGPRMRATVDVHGATYDDLVDKACAAAWALLGEGRRYWLVLDHVEPEVRDADGTVAMWEAEATIRYPYDPEF